ncbi:uncharacterized protein LOC143267744 [Peromyscus maniculatus bairdii]|uniref:uncharacterized protein LOC143267744 n=1 Tax=Peromyscus maniculatus bairdii TaxID=230844 RepID=UPI003FCEFB47
MAFFFCQRETPEERAYRHRLATSLPGPQALWPRARRAAGEEVGPVSQLRARQRSGHGRGASPASGRALGLVTQSFPPGHALRRPRPAPLTTPSTPLAPPREEEPRLHLRPRLRGGPESEEEEGDEDNERRAVEDAEEEGEADQQDGPCCRSSLSSSRWGAGGGAGGGGYGRAPAAWDRVRVDGGSGGGGGCRDGDDGRRDSELRGAAARTSAVIFHTMC